MKKIVTFLLIFSFAFTVTAHAIQNVRIVPKAIQKIEYDNDVSGNSKEYFGWAAIDTATSAGSWKIMRITYATANATDDFVIEWADGNALYDNVWDSRTSLTYK